jgi:hypothetical protein
MLPHWQDIVVLLLITLLWNLYDACSDGMLGAGKLQVWNSEHTYIRSQAFSWHHCLRQGKLGQCPGLHLLLVSVTQPSHAASPALQTGGCEVLLGMVNIHLLLLFFFCISAGALLS